jgi:hypothetical protein
MFFVGVLPLSLPARVISKVGLYDKVSFLIVECFTSANYFYSPSSAQNSIIEFETQIVIKLNFQNISYI